MFITTGEDADPAAGILPQVVPPSIEKNPAVGPSLIRTIFEYPLVEVSGVIVCCPVVVNAVVPVEIICVL
jgi:hypothetical protein